MEPHVWIEMGRGWILGAPQINLSTNGATKMVAPFANGLKWDYWLYKENHNFLYSIIANISGEGQWDHQDHLHKFPQSLDV